MQKLTAADPETKSPDLATENLARLRALFPELVAEGPDGVAVNLDVLKQLVGDRTVTDAEEKYGLNWHGKRRARQLALTPSTGTLRPCPEDSVDWDTTQNLMIEGDNLEVLKLLQKSYAGKVKLIYIDPPYNTGKDFVYPDNFQDNIKNYLELTGQTGEGGKKLSSNTEASGRFHTDWLNMMYPRLKLARNLLREDGVMFVSIADHEIHNLRSAMDEVFGPENFIATVIWHKMDSPKNTATHFSEDHDYVVVFAKEAETWQANGLERTDAMIARYKNPDNDPRGVWLLSDLAARNFYAQGRYPITTKSGKVIPGPPAGSYWRLSRERFDELDKDNRIWWGESGDNRPGIKRFLSEVRQGVVPQTYWPWKDVGSTRNAKQELSQVMGAEAGEDLFITPKPTKLVERMLQIGTAAADTDIVLDFFGGSGTTGHAALSANAKDNGNRRYILVQLPEPTGDPKRPTIAELTKERLRRAGSMINEQLAVNKKKSEGSLFTDHCSLPIDLGFRVFKLASSNIQEWEPDRENLAETLEASIDHLKNDRTEQDILFELLLKLGLDLCVPIETKQVTGEKQQAHTIHSIGGGSLLVCLSPAIPQADVEPLALGLVAWYRALKPAGETTVVFRDSAFADDVAKTNLTAILQQHGLETVRSL
ncbi:MAG: site-specific DNA-methyltransferase [Gemmatimonadales bacterium]|nr:site-specific DNA-methyltransferase [Gemmatimonadales bacterium]